MRPLILFLALVLASCQNQSTPPPSTDAGTTTPPLAADTPGVDTVIGVAGSERARMVQENNEYVYRYAATQVRVTPNAEEPGEKIAFVRGNGAPTALNVPEAGYFHGLSGDFLFIDAGTGPNGRQLSVVDLRNNNTVLTTDYTGEADLANGMLRFFVPIDEKQANPKPACPEKEEWLKNGLGVGYAQRTVYDLQGAKTRVERTFTCFAMQ